MVRIEDRWERAALKEITEDAFKMLLIDKYITMNIPKENVRQIPLQLASDFFTQLCEVNVAETAKNQIQPLRRVLADIVYDENNKRFVLNLN